jgi:hypothetical protein
MEVRSRVDVKIVVRESMIVEWGMEWGNIRVRLSLKEGVGDRDFGIV